MDGYARKHPWFLNFHLKLIGSRNHSLNLIGSGQGQRPPVFFYNIYKFLKHNMYIGFYIIKTKK